MKLVDALIVLFSALIGFILSICTNLINSAIDKKGKLKIYYSIYSSANITEKFGFFSNNQKIAFIVPMNLEIQNTSNVTKVIRDLSIFLYSNGRKFKKMIHVAHTANWLTTDGIVTERKEKQFGTHNNSYSFVIPPRSIQRQYCNFLYAIEHNLRNDNQFDEIKLMFYDENDKEHIFDLRNIEKCWSIKECKADEDWILAK